MPLPLLLAAAPAIMQGVQGLAQLIGGNKARREAEANRPQYSIPNAAQQALTLSRAQYADPFMAGEGRMLDQNNLAAANAGRAAIEGGAGLSAMAAIQAQQSAGAANIGIASANQQRADQENYQGQLGTMANYQDQKWQMNQYAPWSRKANRAEEAIGAGTQNLFGALNSAANIGLGQAMMKGAGTPNVNPVSLAQTATQGMSATQQLNGQYDAMSYDPAAAQSGNYDSVSYGQGAATSPASWWSKHFLTAMHKF